MRTITRCLLSLGLVLGLLAATVAPASATPNPPYGQWLDLSNQWSPLAPSSQRCWLTFSQGMTNGHPYAKIKRVGVTPTCSSSALSGDASGCYLTRPTYNGYCYITLEITWQTGPTSYGQAWVNLVDNANDQSWRQVTAPVAASFVDARIYSNAFTWLSPTTNPAAVDNDPTYGGGVRLLSWFQSS